MHMLLKEKSPSLPRNLVLETFGKLLIVFSTKVNLLYLLYSMSQRCCLLHLIKQNCLLKTFLRTLILMAQEISLPVFPSRVKMKLQNISVTPNMVQKGHNKPWFIKGLMNNKPWFITLDSEDLFCCNKLKKLWAITAEQATENHADEWYLAWYSNLNVITKFSSSRST